jgi:NAD(P)-dependent dehydrogenase (short-subunit alcohol dehydrogenase family)
VIYSAGLAGFEPMSPPRFQGKVAAVTGGGRGLGRAIVRGLAAEGAAVAFSYRESEAGALQEAEALRSRGVRVETIAADARRPGEMAAFVEEAARRLGGLDLLVNNVGVFRRVELDGLTEELLDEAFDVNVKAAVMASRSAAPHLRARRGAIVNVASLGGLRPWRAYLPYCASKAALIMATQCLALALAPDVRVNAVAPGILEPPGAPEALREKIPLKRFGTTAEAVDAVLYLAAAATYTTGEVISLDGGRRHA